MIPEIYKIKSYNEGFLAIMAKPRNGDWLEDEICGLSALGVNVVVSLLDFGEILELGLREEKKICEANGLEYIAFPIKDRSVPESPAHTVQFVRNLHLKLLAGQRIVIHCRAGIGRSGLIAACLLLHSHEAPGKAFALISKARRVDVPDTQEQKNWVSKIYRFYKKKTDIEAPPDTFKPWNAKASQCLWAIC